MKEAQRVVKLAEELFDAWESDTQKTKVRRVNRKDAAAIARMLHTEMDVGTQAREAFAAESGLEIACKKGCSSCCETLVFVLGGEATAVATWLMAPENAEVRAWYETSYERWRADVGDAPERAHQALLADSREAFNTSMRKILNEHVMCAFNRDGECAIYPVRPLYCRNSHALDTPEFCVSTSKEPPHAMQFVPLEAFMSRARPLAEAVHSGLGEPKGVPTPLCETVHRLLDSGSIEPTTTDDAGRKIGRNEPCPCGSGNKFKRCCG